MAWVFLASIGFKPFLGNTNWSAFKGALGLEDKALCTL
jgi:hypothetical protein